MARLCTDKYRKLHMDKRITIQAVTNTADGAGGFTQGWATSHTAWAAIMPLSANERWRVMQMETPATHKVIMKWQSGITTKHRMIFNSRIFNIHEVLNIDESNVIVELMATEGAAV